MEIILSAYGKVASKRIIDNIPMMIEMFMFEPLITKLKKKIKVTDVELENMMQEDPTIVNQRKLALTQLKSMEDAEIAFRNLKARRFNNLVWSILVKYILFFYNLNP